MGEKSAQNVVDAIIEQSKTDHAAAAAVRARHSAGRANPRRCALAQQFGSVEKLGGASAAEIEETPDVGPIVSRSVFEFFRASSAKSVVERLEASGVTYEPIKVEERASLPLAGLTFVITGTLAGLQRDAAEGRAARARRKGVGQCLEEDQLSRRRRRRRLKARQGAVAGRAHPRRGRARTDPENETAAGPGLIQAPAAVCRRLSTSSSPEREPAQAPGGSRVRPPSASW